VAFTHNGFIEGFRHGPQRAIRDSLGKEAYESIQGASDSEHIFALVLDGDLRTAVKKLEGICSAQNKKAIATIVLGDGEQLTALRWAHGATPATLYGAQWGNGFCFASEPLDPSRGFAAIPERKIAIARGRELVLEDL
jgi:predicted glutamine amidotransferase